MLASDLWQFKIRFHHPLHIAIGNALEESGILRFVLRDELVSVFKIVFFITGAGSVYPLAISIGNVPEYAADLILIVIRGDCIDPAVIGGSRKR